MQQNFPIILGSQSPRRKNLLESLGLKFDTQPMDLDETFPPNMSPLEVPEYLAKLKAEPFKISAPFDTAVITSDTVVIYNSKILGKPADATDALSMIMELSGSHHQVVTGVSILFRGEQITFSNISEVFFDEISEDEARYYIDLFKPLDKAGSYGVQEWIGFAKISGIKGCYYNIMGLPLNAVYNALKKLGVIA